MLNFTQKVFKRKSDEKERRDNFDKELKYVVPFEECKVDVEIPRIVETSEESAEEFNDIWKDIDANGLRKNCFLSAQEIEKSKDLSQISYAILKLRFLEPISHLKVDFQSLSKGKVNSLLGKILITDDKSHALLDHIIDLKYLKKEPISITVEFNIRDNLPKKLTERYHLIYLVSVNEMSEQEFDKMIKRLSERQSVSQSVFEFFLFSDSDQKRLKKLMNLSQTSTISGVHQLGAFQPIDHNIVVLDCCLDMNWLIQKESKLNHNLVERMAKLVTNFLEQIGEFPTVFRFYKSFSKINKSIAERILQLMTEIAKQRRLSNESRHENNFELLIIDRTIDLVTPLIHCLQYRPFVFNELEREYKNDMNSKYRELNNISVNKTSILRQKLTEISGQKSAKEGSDEVLAQKLNQNITNARQVFNKIRNKLFFDLLDFERSSLDNSRLRSDNKFVKSIRQLISQTDKDVTNSDLKRLFIINSLIRPKSETNEEIRQMVGNGQQKERHFDLTVIDDFVQFTKNFVQKQSFPLTEPIISTIVGQYLSDSLSYEEFPELYRKSSKTGLKRKLIVFVLGGLSYNDLTSISRFEKNVIFCSNALITPNMLINSIVYQ